MRGKITEHRLAEGIFSESQFGFPPQTDFEKEF